MKHTSRLLGMVSTAVLATLVASPALAAGTLAGTSITNVASISYSVNSIAQTGGTASNSVLVDRKVVFTLTNVGATTSVTPGQSSAVDTFTLTNGSNDTLDFGLAAVNQATGQTAAHAGLDAFDVSGVTYYNDTNGNGIYDAGDTAITWADEVAPDTSRTIFVVSNIPLTPTNGQISGVILTATAEAGNNGVTGSQGSVLANSTGAWTPGTVQTVLADLSGNGGDVSSDGKYTAKGDYTVYAPALTLNKLSSIISDPINGTTNPKSIPGAIMEYCIVVQNGAGGAPTTALGVNDPLPTTVTYNSAYGIFVNGTYTGTACNADGTAGTGANSSYTAAAGVNPAVVTGTLNNVAAGGATTMRFRVTIN